MYVCYIISESSLSRPNGVRGTGIRPVAKDMISQKPVHTVACIVHSFSK